MFPLISIIIPIYNSAHSLCRCLNSIKRQTYQNFEVLLINDGSQDDSESICRSYIKEDDRFVYYKQENSGVSSARNRGLDLARGHYVTFVDADDWLEINLLQDAINVACREDVDIVRYGYWKESPTSTELICAPNAKYIIDKDEMICYNESCGYYGYVWAGIYRASSIGTLRFNEDIKWCEDHMFMYNLFLSCSSLFLMSDPLYHYKINGQGDSLSTRVSPIEIIDVLLLECQLLSQFGNKIDAITVEICQNKLFSAIRNAYKQDYNYKYRKVLCDLICDNELNPGKNYILQIFTNKMLPFFCKDLILNVMFYMRYIFAK